MSFTARIAYLDITPSIILSKYTVVLAQGGFVPSQAAISYNVQFNGTKVRIQGTGVDYTPQNNATANRVRLLCIGY